MLELNTVFYIVILIISVVIHEVSHGFAALHYGDETAKHAGRLTLNPIKHLDPFGSVILPLILILTNAGFVIGWAKPVPFNENNLRDRTRGTIAIALAGILANLFIAIIFGLLIRVVIAAGYGNSPVLIVASLIVLVNLLLAFFNLIPIPPLDGSRIIGALLPYQVQRKLEPFAPISIGILLFFILFGWQYVSPLIFKSYVLLTGLPLPF